MHSVQPLECPVRRNLAPAGRHRESERILDGIRLVIVNGKSRSRFETKRYTKDRRILEVSLSASRYCDHQGDPDQEEGWKDLKAWLFA